MLGHEFGLERYKDEDGGESSIRLRLVPAFRSALWDDGPLGDYVGQSGLIAETIGETSVSGGNKVFLDWFGKGDLALVFQDHML